MVVHRSSGGYSFSLELYKTKLYLFTMTTLLRNLLSCLDELLPGVTWLALSTGETSPCFLMGRHEACSHAGGKENRIPALRL